MERRDGREDGEPDHGESCQPGCRDALALDDGERRRGGEQRESDAAAREKATEDCR